MQQDASEIRENELLAELPSEDFERLLPRLERVVLPPFEVLYDFDDEITHVYFPNRNNGKDWRLWRAAATGLSRDTSNNRLTVNFFPLANPHK